MLTTRWASSDYTTVRFVRDRLRAANGGALRLSTHASPVTYLFRFRGQHDASEFVLASSALPSGWRFRHRPGSLFSRRSLFSGSRRRVDACGSSQVSRRFILCLCPVPRSRLSRRALAHTGRQSAPALSRAKASAINPISRLRAALTPAVNTSRIMVPSPCKTRFRLAGLCPEGVKPLRLFSRGRVARRS
jgi:hypothetical protein